MIDLELPTTLDDEDLQGELERAYARFQRDHDMAPERTLVLMLNYALANLDDLDDILSEEE